MAVFLVERRIMYARIRISTYLSLISLLRDYTMGEYSFNPI